MKKSLPWMLLTCGCLGVVLTAGCGQTQSTMTPTDKAKFGTYGQPMPEAAKQYMAQHAAQSRPAAAAPSAAPATAK